MLPLSGANLSSREKSRRNTSPLFNRLYAFDRQVTNELLN